jgi:hypothetical protein
MALGRWTSTPDTCGGYLKWLMARSQPPMTAAELGRKLARQKCKGLGASNIRKILIGKHHIAKIPYHIDHIAGALNIEKGSDQYNTLLSLARQEALQVVSSKIGIANSLGDREVQPDPPRVKRPKPIPPPRSYIADTIVKFLKYADDLPRTHESIDDLTRRKYRHAYYKLLRYWVKDVLKWNPETEEEHKIFNQLLFQYIESCCKNRLWFDVSTYDLENLRRLSANNTKIGLEAKEWLSAAQRLLGTDSADRKI